MQNTSETSHPGNKQKSLHPWEASTGGKSLLWTRATAEKSVWERLTGSSLARSCRQGVIAASHGSHVCLALKGEGGGAVRGADWDLWSAQGHDHQEIAQSRNGSMEYGITCLLMALVESKKKPKKRSVALSSMSNTAYSPGQTSGDCFLTRWVFLKQKASSSPYRWTTTMAKLHQQDSAVSSALAPWTVQPSQEHRYDPCLGHSPQYHIIDVGLMAFKGVNVGGEKPQRVI